MIADASRTLHPGWAWTTLGELRLEARASINPASFPTQSFELYSVPSYDTGRPEVVQGADVGSSKQTVDKDCVLVCKINPRINRVWVVGDFTRHPKIASTEWIPFPVIGGVMPHYLRYVMSQHAFRDFLAGNVSGVGGSLMRVRPSTLAEYPLPLPPLPEQRRIVAKIEELFSKLDAGVEELNKARAQLKRYRQSVLKAAFEGKLTEEWRRAHKGKVEPASVLLDRIEAERKKALGSKYKEPPPLDTSELPELPEGWAWARLSMVTHKIQDGTHFSPAEQYAEPGPDRYPYVTSKNIRDWGMDLADITYVSEGVHRTIYDRCDPELDDVLLVKDGVNTGTTTVNTLEGEFSLLSSVALLKPVREATTPQFLRHYLASPTGQRMIAGRMSGTAIRRIILERIREAPISIAPLLEQRAIAEEIDLRLSVVDAEEKAIEAALKQAERLRQSILKRAFEGKLVPQDPSDEPADRLLERIRVERAKAITEGRCSRTRLRHNA